MSEASVCSTNVSVKSGQAKTGAVVSAVFNESKALSSSAVHCHFCFLLMSRVRGRARSEKFSRKRRYHDNMPRNCRTSRMFRGMRVIASVFSGSVRIPLGG